MGLQIMHVLTVDFAERIYFVNREGSVLRQFRQLNTKTFPFFVQRARAAVSVQ